MSRLISYITALFLYSMDSLCFYVLVKGHILIVEVCLDVTFINVSCYYQVSLLRSLLKETRLVLVRNLPPLRLSRHLTQRLSMTTTTMSVTHLVTLASVPSPISSCPVGGLSTPLFSDFLCCSSLSACLRVKTSLPLHPSRST